MKVINTKEEIKNRMIRKAAQLWGVPISEIDSSFDPLVSLLIGACASQIAEIDNEANSSHARVADTLINLMTPDASSGVSPAHAIAHANPVDSYSLLRKNYQFYTKKKVVNAKGDVSFKTAYFSSICDLKLINAFLQFAVVGNQLIEFNEENKSSNTFSFKTEVETIDSSTKILLGFPKTEQAVSLKGIPVFLELNDIANKNSFYTQLKNINIKFQGRPVSFHFGIEEKTAHEKKNIHNVFSNKSSKTITAEKSILSFYDRNFITIDEDIFLNSEISNTNYQNSRVNTENEKLSGVHWLEIEFPTSNNNSFLKYLYASINCFPVINRKLENATYSLNEFNKIIPIPVKDAFLDMDSITNENGKTYKSLEKGGEVSKGTYFLKMDHIGRLDSFKAKDQLEKLIDMLKNETAAFSVFGNDFINEMVHKLTQDISLLENKVASVEIEKTENKYISVNPFSEKETLFVDYWTTIGEQANNIRSNTPLLVYKGGDIDQANCFLVTTSLGGKDILNTQEKIYKYRRSILSQERIVTKQDVMNLCFDVAGNTIINATVERKFVSGERRNEGYIPNMCISLFKNNEIKTSELEWDLIKSNILSVLKEQSHNILPYTIVVI